MNTTPMPLKISTILKKINTYQFLNCLRIGIIYLTCIFSLKIIGIVLEIVYRSYCYPISFYGLFLSFFTSNTDACKFIRTINVSIDALSMKMIMSVLYTVINTFYEDIKTSWNNKQY
jgi:hypothetical protein